MPRPARYLATTSGSWCRPVQPSVWVRLWSHNQPCLPLVSRPIGPGKVLAGLVRRIAKGTPVSFIDNSDSLQKALQGNGFTKQRILHEQDFYNRRP